MSRTDEDSDPPPFSDTVATVRNHEKRISAIEKQRLDKDIKTLTERLDDTEEKVATHIEKTTTTLDDFKAFKWKTIGMATIGASVGGIVSAIVIYVITKQL